MKWLKRLVGRLEGLEPVPWEEAELLEKFPSRFLREKDGQPLLSELPVMSFLDTKDNTERFYWGTEVAKHWLLKLFEPYPGLRVLESPEFLMVSPYTDRTVGETFQRLESKTV